MASPEHQNSTVSPSPTLTGLTAALADINHQLEKADAIENPIERFHKRDDLLEQYDDLQAEFDLAPALPELS